MKTLLNFTVLIMAIIATVYIDGCFRKKQKEPVVQYVNPLTDTVKHWKDAYNAEHAQVQLEINSREAIVAMHKGYVDSICKRLNITRKQLKSATSMAGQLKGAFTTKLIPVYVHDSATGLQISTSAKMFQWHDDWMDINGVVDSNNISCFYSGKLSFDITTYKKRKHHIWKIRWGRPIYYLDATCKNKNFTIENLTGIQINK